MVTGLLSFENGYAWGVVLRDIGSLYHSRIEIWSYWVDMGNDLGDLTCLFSSGSGSLPNVTLSSNTSTAVPSMSTIVILPTQIDELITMTTAMSSTSIMPTLSNTPVPNTTGDAVTSIEETQMPPIGPEDGAGIGIGIGVFMIVGIVNQVATQIGYKLTTEGVQHLI